MANLAALLLLLLVVTFIVVPVDSLPNRNRGTLLDKAMRKYASESKPMKSLSADWYCNWDEDCPSNAYCYEGSCYEHECSDDYDCPGSLVCRAHFCVEYQSYEVECAFDNDCPYYPYQKCLSALSKCYNIF